MDFVKWKLKVGTGWVPLWLCHSELVFCKSLATRLWIYYLLQIYVDTHRHT